MLVKIAEVGIYLSGSVHRRAVLPVYQCSYAGFRVPSSSKPSHRCYPGDNGDSH